MPTRRIPAALVVLVAGITNGQEVADAAGRFLPHGPILHTVSDERLEPLTNPVVGIPIAQPPPDASAAAPAAPPDLAGMTYEMT